MPAKDARLASVDRAHLVVIAVDPHTDAQTNHIGKADLQQHVAAGQRLGRTDRSPRTMPGSVTW